MKGCFQPKQRTAKSGAVRWHGAAQPFFGRLLFWDISCFIGRDSEEADEKLRYNFQQRSAVATMRPFA